MNAAGSIALVLVFGLCAAMTASAQEIALPDRARLQTLSQEELAAYREQIQIRIEGLGAAEQRLMRETSVNGRSQLENANVGGEYGRGYGSRGGQGAGQGRGSAYGRGGGRHR